LVTEVAKSELLPLHSEPCPGSEAHKVWEECRKTSKSVEVVYRNAEEEEILTRVNFKFDKNVYMCKAG
jgi:hypothetical protein